MKILILGSNGMLGSMNFKYLFKACHDVHTCEYRFPSEQFKNYVKNFDGDFIINCIGAIPQKTNDFSVNYELPLWLDQNVNIRIIHPATDCQNESDGPYGKSKKDCFEYLLNNSKKTKIIQCSIIGPEINSKKSLFEWFLNSKSDVSGFTEAIWNGITTLEWAKNCENLMNNWDASPINTIIHSDPVSKFELLNIIKKVFNKDINVIPVNLGKNKCLIGNLKTKSIEDQLIELKYFILNN